MRAARRAPKSWATTVLALGAVALGGAISGCASTASTDPAAPPPAAEPGPPAVEEGAQDEPPIVAAPIPVATPGSTRLFAEAARIVRAMRESTYSHTTHVDEAAGTFDMDCSGFVDYALARAAPDAFAPLAAATVKRPVAESYVAFIGASRGPTKPWRSVARAADLVAGDVVAWLEPKDAVSTNTGHVMVVGGSVVVHGDEVQVPVIDSSESGHGTADQRTIARATGIGEGTTVLLIDSRGAPVGYRWSVEAVSVPHLTTVVLAHLD